MELPVGFASGMSAAIISLNGRFQSSGDTPDGDIFVVALWLNEAADLYCLAFLFLRPFILMLKQGSSLLCFMPLSQQH
jgi:hypothetical protein